MFANYQTFMKAQLNHIREQQTESWKKWNEVTMAFLKPMKYQNGNAAIDASALIIYGEK